MRLCVCKCLSVVGKPLQDSLINSSPAVENTTDKQDVQTTKIYIQIRHINIQCKNVLVVRM